MFERAKFYSVDDLSNSIGLLRAEQVLERYIPRNEYSDINDIIELYNIKLFIDNHLALKSWNDDKIAKYVKIISNFGNDIVIFFRKYITVETAVSSFSKVTNDFQQDYWDIFERFGLIDILTEEFMNNTLAVYPDQIENILHCEKIVKQNDAVLSVFLCSYPNTAHFLINSFLISDISRHARALYIPKSLTDTQRTTIVDSYLDSEHTTLGLVRIIMQSKDVPGLVLNPKIRLKAKKLEPQLATIPSDAMVSTVQTGYTIEFSQQQGIAPVQQYLDGLFLKYVYSETYLDKLSDTELINVFNTHFGYLDNNGLLSLCYNRNEDGISESLDTREVKGLYRMNNMFRMKNNIAVSQLAMFDNYLRRKGKTLEEIMKSYYEKHFKKEYSYPAPNLSFPKDDDNNVNKNKVIAPEMEAVVKQYDLFVEEGVIDSELYSIRMPLPIALGKSLLRDKHKYAVINDGCTDIYKPMYLLFSDQSLLSFVEPFKNSHYHTLFKLLDKEDKVEYSKYEYHQKPNIDYLIENGYLINDNGILKLGNIARITALHQIFNRREISYYHCQPDVRAEIDKMVIEGWLKYDDYLLSPKERHYINFYLNTSEYTNGMQLRNKYSHGVTSCIEFDEEHKNAYYYFLMIFVIILLKMDEDMKISSYLDKQAGNSYQ